MTKKIYLYVLDSMAEWEVGNILQAISMKSMLKQGTKFEIITVSNSKRPVKTIGGLTIIPECILEEIDEENIVALLLPGAEAWGDEINKPVLDKALCYIDNGVLVGAVCGATLALAELNVLNNYKHTSNSLDYLTLFSKQYNGKDFYVDSPAFLDKNLVTASAAGGLLWAKYILEYLEVYPIKTIELWYNYYTTGDPKHLIELISG